MNMRDHIEAKIAGALAPVTLEVLDESANHSRGSESHFKVTVVTRSFEGQRLLARHRQINALLADELKQGVHALAIHTFTPQEWAARRESLASPECAHGEPRSR